MRLTHGERQARFQRRTGVNRSEAERNRHTAYTRGLLRASKRARRQMAREETSCEGGVCVMPTEGAPPK